MIAVGGVDVRSPAAVAGDAMVEVGEVVEVIEVLGEEFFLTVDFERVECVVAAGVAGGLEDGKRAVFETADEGAGVVDGDGLFLVGGGVDVVANKSPVTVEPAAFMSKKNPPQADRFQLIQMCEKS